MEIIKTEKINLKKHLTITFYIMAILLVLIITVTSIIGGVKYSDYKDGQDLAIEATMLFTSEFDYINNRKELVEEMYEYLNQTYPVSFSSADYSLGDYLTEEGYPCFRGSEYLVHTNYFSYYFDQIAFVILWIVFAALLITLGIFTLLYKRDKKTAIVLEESTITCKKANGTEVQFMLKDVKNIELTGKNGLKIQGTGGIKYSIKLISNAVDVKSEIISRLS